MEEQNQSDEYDIAVPLIVRDKRNLVSAQDNSMTPMNNLYTKKPGF
ncbi:MAG TPA: hypothetical protein V6C58_27605 [Allocoleopsis sp.]